MFAGLVVVAVVVVSRSPTFTVTASSTLSPSAAGSKPSEAYGGVSCTSVSFCTAVGSYLRRQRRIGGLIAAVAQGKTWSMESIPTPSGVEFAYFNAVSCSATSSCLAVGFGTVKSGQSDPIAEYWNGSTWSIVSPPLPAGASGSILEGVACASATSCTVLGHTLNSTDTVASSLAELWNGTTWVVEPTPSPAGSTGSDLSSVSCLSPLDCTAVGSVEIGSTAQTLAEIWNGATWSIEATPNPPAATTSGFLSVSCSAADACTAVGASEPQPADYSTLAENWNGSAWSIEPTPVLPGASQAGLRGVSCLKVCVAVGYFTDTQGVGAFAEVWDGETWSVESIPSPARATSDSLLAISCVSFRSCVAVGGSTDKNADSPLIEHWNGTKWVIRRE